MIVHIYRYNCNDSHVGEEVDPASAINGSAYLLFYQRRQEVFKLMYHLFHNYLFMIHDDNYLFLLIILFVYYSY